MAKRRKKTKQQIARQNEIRNLRRRARRLEKNLEKQFGRNITININEYLSNLRTPLTAKEISKIRGEKLNSLFERKAYVEFDGVNVNLKEYKRVLANVEKAQKLARKYHSDRIINEPNRITSLAGFKKYSKSVSAFASRAFWVQENNRFISNFMKSVRALGENSIGYRQISEAINKLGISKSVEILRELVNSRINISASFYFSSDQGRIMSTLSEVFSAFGLNYNPNVDYSAKEENDLDFEEMDEAEYSEIMSLFGE